MVYQPQVIIIYCVANQFPFEGGGGLYANKSVHELSAVSLSASSQNRLRLLRTLSVESIRAV